MSGFPTLLYKEVLRFWKVSFQTVAAPVLTTILYLLVFSHALAGHVQAFPGVTGPITFDADRNPVKPAVVIKIENGVEKFAASIAP